MHYLSLDYLIVYAFLLITLYIGLRASRGIKDIREYAVGDRGLGTGVLLLTFMATNLGGASIIGTTSNVFQDGVVMIAALSGVAISMLMINFLVVPHVGRFSTAITAGDVMGHLYGSYSQLLTGVLGVLYAISMVSLELTILGELSESLFGLKAAWTIVIAGMLLALYTAHGGIKSVTATDVFQFLVLCIMLPYIASMSIKEVGSLSDVFSKTPSTHFNVFSRPDFSFYLTLFLMWSIFPVGLTSPAIFQRLLMARSVSDLRRQYFIAAAFDPLVQVTVMLIGLAGVVLYPTVEAKEILPHIIMKLLPVGIKGVAMAGLVAVIMSTADSYLHSAGLLLVHDVAAPISRNLGGDINELRWVRYATVSLGLFAVLISLRPIGLIEYSFAAMRFTGPVLLFPLIMGIAGVKPDKRDFYTAMAVTLVIFVLLRLTLSANQSHLSVLISLLVNGLVFSGMHVVRHKGFVIVKNRGAQEILWLPQKKHWVTRLKSLFIRPKAILQYSQNSVAKYGASYVLFGAFCCINFTFPYFMWTDKVPHAHDLVSYSRLAAATMCGLLIVKEKWPSSYYPIFPPFGTLLCSTACLLPVR
ncbi:MAG: sodium:solute symporter family protein [Bacteroidota bacterium]